LNSGLSEPARPRTGIHTGRPVLGPVFTRGGIRGARGGGVGSGILGSVERAGPSPARVPLAATTRERRRDQQDRLDNSIRLAPVHPVDPVGVFFLSACHPEDTSVNHSLSRPPGEHQWWDQLRLVPPYKVALRLWSGVPDESVLPRRNLNRPVPHRIEKFIKRGAEVLALLDGERTGELALLRSLQAVLTLV